MPAKTDTNDEVLVSIEQTIEFLETAAEKNVRLAEQMKQNVINPIVLAKVCGIPPQMVYSYIKKGYIERDSNNTQKIVIELNEAIRFVMKRLNRSASEQLKIVKELEGVTS